MALKGVTSYNNGQYSFGTLRLGMHSSFVEAIKTKSISQNVLRTFIGRKEHIEGATHWLVNIEGVMAVLHIRSGKCYLCTVKGGSIPIWVESDIMAVDNYIQTKCYAYGILTDHDKREILRVRF